MSVVLPTREAKDPTKPLSTVKLPETPKPQRILACVLCQQRKVKCDRKEPCSNCVKAHAQCVSASQLPRRRKRRFPERELLDRLRKYEDLLRRNNIKFEPLHGDVAAERERANGDPDAESTTGSQDRNSSNAGASLTVTPSRSVTPPYKTNSSPNTAQEIYSQDDTSDDDDGEEIMVKRVWNEIEDCNDHLLFGFRKTTGDTSTLHPDPAQIFRLWQVYLENVDPVLKVTHNSSLQAEIAEAASNRSGVRAPLEALMFGMYSMSIFSLTSENCQTMFGRPKSSLLTDYWYGCQQALVKCGFLRTNDRNCLTAFCLYLMSLRHSSMPQSLSSMLGVAVRVAQRMGIDSESALAKQAPLEAELRRRLWWALVIFDARIGELAESKSPSLTPTWDCRIPLNVNDSDLRLKAKELRKAQESPTDAIFAVVRSAIGDFTRHAMSYISSSPSTRWSPKELQKTSVPEAEELERFEAHIEERYLRSCDPDDPLHFMTIWTARSWLAKCHLLGYNARYSASPMHLSEKQRTATVTYALRILESDTRLIASPLTQKFRWLVQFHFPLFAYIQVVQVLKRHPLGEQAEQAWTVMGDNYNAHFADLAREEVPFVLPFFRVFSELVFQAWSACQLAAKQAELALPIPRIVTTVQAKWALLGQGSKGSLMQQVEQPAAAALEVPFSPAPLGFGGNGLAPPAPAYNGNPGGKSGPYADLFDLDQLEMDMSQLDWSVMDWSIAGPLAPDLGIPANNLPSM